MTAGRPAPVAALRRFLRTPKGLFTAVLALLLLVAGAGEGVRAVGPAVLAAVVAAILTDAPILWLRKSRWVFPSGAILTGLIVAMVMSPLEPWYEVAITTVIAVLSKYLVRSRTANVFNPAAFALVATFYVFDSAQSWWGALPEVAPGWMIVLLGTGGFITWRVNKIPAVLSFVGVYYLLFTLTAFVGDPAQVVALYRAPDLHAALFFAFFMVTDPPTSPPRSRDQIVFGVITAVAAYLAFELIGSAYFLLAGLLVANAWEGWRRAK